MKIPVAAALLALATILPAASQAAPGSAPGAAPVASANQPLVDGLVKRVNRDGASVSLAHGPIPNINMPAMTMLFKLKDPSWIAQLKEGQRIRFSAVLANGELLVTRIEPAR